MLQPAVFGCKKNNHGRYSSVGNDHGARRMFSTTSIVSSNGYGRTQKTPVGHSLSHARLCFLSELSHWQVVGDSGVVGALLASPGGAASGLEGVVQRYEHRPYLIGGLASPEPDRAHLTRSSIVLAC